MLRAYRLLLSLFPRHVRVVYGGEMLADYARRLQQAGGSRLRTVLVFVREALSIVPDALSERVAALSSHPSFHGRRPADPGVVRPPNVGKAEWFK